MIVQQKQKKKSEILVYTYYNRFSNAIYGKLHAVQLHDHDPSSNKSWQGLFAFGKNRHATLLPLEFAAVCARNSSVCMNSCFHVVPGIEQRGILGHVLYVLCQVEVGELYLIVRVISMLTSGC